MAKPQKSNNTLFIFIIICLILVFLFLTLGNIVLKQYSITFDEKSHYKYGDIIYHLKTNRFDDSKMPVSVLNVIPVKIAENLFHVTFTKQAQRVKLGRISTVLISLLLAYLCYKWTSSLYGVWVGLVGFGLYIFEPNIIAHSQLVTTDIYSAASTTLFLYGCWRFFESPDFKRGILLGPCIRSRPDQQILLYSVIPHGSPVCADSLCGMASNTIHAKILEKHLFSFLDLD